MELDVGVTHARATADEAAGLEMVGRSQALLRQDPARADERLAERRHVRIQGDRLPAGHLKIKLEMVLQVLANTGKLADDRDPVVRQLCGRPDAGELQQLRRVHRATADDHLPSYPHGMTRLAATVADAGRAPAFEENFC